MNKSKSSPGDPNKFENIARELNCDESDDALDKAMGGLDLRIKEEQEDSEEE